MLTFIDILRKAGIDPKKTKLIRLPMTDPVFKECYDRGMIYEYTCHQKEGFSKGYDYWAVFIGGNGSKAQFYALYRVGDAMPDDRNRAAKKLPEAEADRYCGENLIYELEHQDILKEYEYRLTIEWGKSRMWHQRAVNDKEIVSIRADRKKVFSGFEDLVISYDELKEIIENEAVYAEWHAAFSAIYAIYLIMDTETGMQYVGSAYGNEGGLLETWSCYVKTQRGNTKQMRKLICYHPDRYHRFRFSVLQILPKTLTAEEVKAIELRYKRKLMSREFGMNEN